MERLGTLPFVAQPGEAYVYGYPLVTMEMTRRVMTNVAKAAGKNAPMGQFANMKEYPTADFKDITAPNADTLYSVAWLNLAVLRDCSPSTDKKCSASDSISRPRSRSGGTCMVIVLRR